MGISGMNEYGGLGPDDIVDLWRKRFGQPPPIITDSETMLRIMSRWPPRSFAPPETVERAIEHLGRERLLGPPARGSVLALVVGGEETTP